MLPEYFEFYNPVKLLCGQWSLENIPYELGRLRVKKPLMLVSGTMLRQGILQMMGEPMPMVAFRRIPPSSWSSDWLRTRGKRAVTEWLPSAAARCWIQPRRCECCWSRSRPLCVGCWAASG